MRRQETHPDAKAIEEQLQRILGSKIFLSAQRSQAFLRFVVNRSLTDAPPKEFEIAVEALGRGADYDPAVDATVRVEAGRLRNRLREYYDTEGRADPIVIDIPKGAYAAVFSLREVARPDADPDRTGMGLPPPGAPRDAAGVPKPAEQPAVAVTPDKGRRRWWWMVAAAVLLLAGAARWLIRDAAHAGRVNSLAVIPLENLSGDPNEDYFVDGMTDELITELAQIPSLRVVSRTSVMQDKGTRKSLQQIGRELDVDAVVEGSVVRSGNRVRITAQLIDVRADKHLWAQSFEGQQTDILALQDTVAREIAAQAKVAMTPELERELHRATVINPEAHDAYLRGLYFVEKRQGQLAARYFRHAIDLEPQYAAAFGGLSQALSTEAETSQGHASDLMPAAIAAARRAIELDPGIGEAYTALGVTETTYLWDWRAAERDLKKGIALSPNSSLAEIRYAIYLTAVNRPDEAVTHMRRAVELDPLSFFANRYLGTALFYDRHYDEALSALQRAEEIAPDQAGMVAQWTSDIYEMQGKYDQAVESDVQANDHDQQATGVRSAYTRGGWAEYQRAIIRSFPKTGTEECDDNTLALAYIRLGRFDEAFRSLNREADLHCVYVLVVPVDPRFDGVRHDPRYAALLRRMHLRE